MRRVVIVIVIVSLAGLCGCAARESARWVPRLVVGARVVERTRASTGEAEQWDWRLDGALRWELASAPRVEPDDLAPTLLPEPRCTSSEALCAWERRARARAYEAAVRSLD